MNSEVNTVPAVQLDAMVRWLDLGTNTLTNPVLKFALQTFLEPIGIAGEWLEYDVVSASITNASPRLHKPAFKAALIRDLNPEFQKAFAPLRDHPTRYAATLGVFGHLQISPHPPVRKPDEIDRQLAYSATAAPVMAREAMLFCHRYLIVVGELLGSTDESAYLIQSQLGRGDFIGFAKAALEASAKQP